MNTSSSPMMKSQALNFLQVYTKINPKPSCFTHNAPCFAKFLKNPTTSRTKFKYMVMKLDKNSNNNYSPHDSSPLSKEAEGNDFWWTTGTAASVGIIVVVLMMGCDKAWAFGPEGPMVEEFWENMRRYALYALTVGTGVIYTVFQPIYELLKNPISAVLVLIIIGGSIFIVSQILSAMVGVSDFSYEYSY